MYIICTQKLFVNISNGTLQGGVAKWGSNSFSPSAKAKGYLDYRGVERSKVTGYIHYMYRENYRQFLKNYLAYFNGMLQEGVAPQVSQGLSPFWGVPGVSWPLIGVRTPFSIIFCSICSSFGIDTHTRCRYVLTKKLTSWVTGTWLLLLSFFIVEEEEEWNFVL